jgi:UDP-2-acetamido-3-amino-2,3-dideoxy-glucuronate N-acetyltransferase
MKKNIAVIGCGYWGKNLVRNFHELGALRSVCDANEETLRAIISQYDGVTPLGDMDKVLADKEIEAVAIASPAILHYELARKVLLAGKDVYVEKPLALKASEGEELVRLAKERGRVLMVGHILHYHPAVKALKTIVSKGMLGRIRYVYSNRLSFGKIRREENILWSFAPHDISMILGLLGEKPTEVTAQGSHYLHPDIADVTMSQMKFASGVNAHIFVSWLHPFKEQKLVVVGEDQMAVFDDTVPWESKLTLYPHEVVWKDGIPEAKKADGKAVPLEKDEPLKAECRHFLECVENRQKPVTDGHEGLDGLTVLNALQESLDQNGTTVSLAHSSSLVTHDYFKHETAVVDPSAKVGEGSKVWHFSHVMKGATVGRKVNIGQNVVISPGCTVGDNVKIQNNISVYTGVHVEDDVFLGPSMVFTNVYNPRSFIERKNEYKDTRIKRGATIGANATVVCGHTIGEYAFIGAGAVVTRDVPPYALFYGNPGKVRGWTCRCGWKLPVDVDYEGPVTCNDCSSKYRISGGKVEMLEKGAYKSTSSS